MKIAKYISIRILAIAILFILLNEVYYFTFWKIDVNKHADTLENLWVVDPNSDGIYFGESSNFHQSTGETKKHRISHILDTLVPNYNIGTVDNAGLHSGTYFSLIRNIAKLKKLKFVVVTMNIRSFGPVWIHSDFETNLSKAERLIAPGPKLWNRFLISMNEYDLKTNQQRADELQYAFINEKFSVPNLPFQCIADWDKAIAWKEWYGVRKLENQEEIALATQYIKNFAFKIDVNTNPRIHDFDAIIDWGNKHNCKVIFNILGENIEEASTLIGPTIVHLIKSNRDILIKRYRNKGAIVVDNLTAIPNESFVDRNWPTEHYNLIGKQIIAKNLADVISRLKF